MTIQDTMHSWLNDAYAMEQNLIQVLESHAQDARNHPSMHARIQQHLEQTRHHADLIEGCINRRGNSPSTVKSGIASITGAVQGVTSAIAPDELVKNVLADFASENFEIASYKSLITAARAIGDEETARVCEQILRDEEDMARWLEQQIPEVTREYLAQQGLNARAV